MSEFFKNSLKHIYDEKDIKLDSTEKAMFSKDWSSIIPSEPIAVVFPREVDQLVDTVKLCNDLSIPFLASGGRTGLSGGATSISNELIISFNKMNKILDFDESDNTILCQPGLITKDLQNFASDNNLFYPIEFSSTGSSQLGGNIATNAGGIKVIKYGLTENYVKGIEVIGGDGLIHDFDKRLVKNATGPNLKNLFIGSEGIFGIFTSCRIRLIKKPPETKVAIIGFNDLNNLNIIRDKILNDKNIESIEFFTSSCVQKIEDTFKNFNKLEIKSKYYILVEYSDYIFENILENLVTFKYVEDIIISHSNSQKNKMWQNRMLISESISNQNPLKFDLAVPINLYNNLIYDMEKLSKSFQDIDVILFGHLGDGNLHVNFVSSDAMKINKKISNKITLEILKLIQKLKGTISAEHGIGVLKKDMFSKTASEKELSVLKNIKALYDPKNLLNPGKLIP